MINPPDSHLKRVFQVRFHAPKYWILPARGQVGMGSLAPRGCIAIKSSLKMVVGVARVVGDTDFFLQITNN